MASALGIGEQICLDNEKTYLVSYRQAGKFPFCLSRTIKPNREPDNTCLNFGTAVNKEQHCGIIKRKYGLSNFKNTGRYDGKFDRALL